MATLVINFHDFKKLAKNHRIYYYEGEDFIDFHFLSDGIVVKSVVPKAEIINLDRFVSDPMFYGSVRLDFNLPLPEPNLVVLERDISTDLKLNINKELDYEDKDLDLQRDEIEDED